MWLYIPQAAEFWVHLGMLRCVKIALLTIALLDMAKFTTVTPLTLLAIVRRESVCSH
jgi:hypothetical protein